MKKDLNFEINILPVLDILSVLICFLLLTAVWVQLGTLDVKQAVGDNSLSGAQNPPSIFATVGPNAVQISLRDIKKAKLPHEITVPNVAEGIDWSKLTEKIKVVKAEIPELKTGVIMPQAHTNYGDVVKLMDQLKQNSITDIGITPLD
jgi:biopolymer transport protein TolR